ncbi:MAG TPA: DUF1841 family protein [Candidatus Acidoferrum sp.]|nr:DUF1841 family protein [Candidatus Acidoferrum sp.]
MFNPSRDEARQFFFDTWRKYRKREVLSPMENMALDVILLHPEYQAVLEDPERYQDMDYLPEMGDTNPFLHMGMHIAVNEQLSIDQPPGIRDRFERLLSKTGEEHAAMHQVMECLAEMIWQAQRNTSSLDVSIYFACLDRSIYS